MTTCTDSSGERESRAKRVEREWLSVHLPVLAPLFPSCLLPFPSRLPSPSSFAAFPSFAYRVPSLTSFFHTLLLVSFFWLFSLCSLLAWRFGLDLAPPPPGVPMLCLLRSYTSAFQPDPFEPPSPRSFVPLYLYLYPAPTHTHILTPL